MLAMLLTLIDHRSSLAATLAEITGEGAITVDELLELVEDVVAAQSRLGPRRNAATVVRRAVRRLYLVGFSPTQVAAILAPAGVDLGMVEHCLRRLARRDDAPAIVRRRREGVGVAVLGREYGVPRSQIECLVRYATMPASVSTSAS